MLNDVEKKVTQEYIWYNPIKVLKIKNSFVYPHVNLWKKVTTQTVNSLGGFQVAKECFP